jgi:hypothetical protein
MYIIGCSRRKASICSRNLVLSVPASSTHIPRALVDHLPGMPATPIRGSVNQDLLDRNAELPRSLDIGSEQVLD